jgi:iron complex outermembrane receptor protein
MFRSCESRLLVGALGPRPGQTAAVLGHGARGVLFTVLALSAASALAQDADQSSPEAQVAQNQAGPTPTPQQLPEVVVTAQFRTQNIQQTPLAISAVSAAQLAQRGQTNLAQLTRDVPSVSLIPSTTAFGPSMSAFIRGVGQNDLDPALEPGVGIYIDDVFFGTITGSLLDLMDLERVEVLRGPQGTLEGMNSLGGAVKLFSRLPEATRSSNFDLLLGSRAHVEVRASTNFTFTDNLFIRLAGVGNFQNGYENVFDFGCANPSFIATATNGVTASYSVAPGFNTRVSTCQTGTQGSTGYAGARASLRWVVNDRLEAIFIGDLTNQNQENPAETLLYAGQAPKIVNGRLILQSPAIDNITIPTTSGALLPYDAAKVPALIPANPYTTYATLCMPAVTNPGNYPPFGSNFNQPAYCGENRTTLKSWGAQSTVNWTISDTLSLKNIFAVRGYSSSWFEDNDASPWPVGLGGDTLGHHQLSEELRLSGSWEKLLDWTAGAFYFSEKSVYSTHQDLWYATQAIPPVAGVPGLLNFIQDDPITAHDRAGYLHTVWHLLPKTDLTLAGRYTSQDKDYSYVRVNPQGGTGGSATLVGPLNGYTGRYAAHRWDYRANVAYHASDELMAYGQVSTGFKGGGVNPRPFYVQQAIPFNPETLTSYELGIKSTWLDNQLRVNVDGYFSQYRAIQLTLLNCGFIPSIGPMFGSPCALPYNAGDAHVKGVELEAQLHRGAWQVDLTGSYLNFTYVHLNYQPAPTLPTCPPGLLCSVTGVTYGMITPFTPNLQGNAGVQYTYDLPVSDAGSLTGRIDVSSRGQIFTNAVNDQYNRIGGFTTFNARLAWEPPTGDWQIAVQVLNFTSKVYFLNVFDLAAAGGGSVVGNPGPPLEVDVQFKHHM